MKQTAIPGSKFSRLTLERAGEFIGAKHMFDTVHGLEGPDPRFTPLIKGATEGIIESATFNGTEAWRVWHSIKVCAANRHRVFSDYHQALASQMLSKPLQVESTEPIFEPTPLPAIPMECMLGPGRLSVVAEVVQVELVAA